MVIPPEKVLLPVSFQICVFWKVRVTAELLVVFWITPANSLVPVPVLLKLTPVAVVALLVRFPFQIKTPFWPFAIVKEPLPDRV